MTDRETVRRRVRRIVKFLILAPIILVIFVFVFGEAVMHLWNWLMPTIFGLPVITFGQAWGLMGLSWILLGGLRGFGGSGRHSRHRAFERMQRWRDMTPEQRTAFRSAMGTRCGEHATGPADTAPRA